MADDAPETDPLRQAAMVVSDLLMMALSRDGEAGRQLYCWERDGVRFLSEQRRKDPDTPINAWTADLVRDHDAGVPLVAGARPGSLARRDGLA